MEVNLLQNDKIPNTQFFCSASSHTALLRRANTAAQTPRTPQRSCGITYVFDAGNALVLMTTSQAVLS